MKYSMVVAACLLGFVCLISCDRIPGGIKSHVVAPDHEWTLDSLAFAVDTAAGELFSLQRAINAARDCDTLILPAGIYYASPRQFLDPLCGNCQEHKTQVNASTGFVIKDKSIVIIGADRDSTFLVSGAGYGVYFEDSEESRLINLKVTGGISLEESVISTATPPMPP
jgi:hypothetical protein